MKKVSACAGGWMSCLIVLMSLFCGIVHCQDLLLVQGEGAYSSRIAKRLRETGIEFKSVAVEKLVATDLNDVKLAIFSNTKTLSDGMRMALEAYVGRGGKIVAFYADDSCLNKLLGIKSLEYVTGKNLPHLTAVQFEQALLRGFPQRMSQQSFSLLRPVPLQGTRMVARWLGKGGVDLRMIAMCENDNGMYFSHVYLDQDQESGSAFFIALLCKYIPRHWEKFARMRLDAIYQIGSLDGREAMSNRVRGSGNQKANVMLSRAGQIADEAQQAFAQRDYAGAFGKACKARELLRKAYIATEPSRPDEFRGIWIHSAYGMRGGNWDETVRLAKESGFNALFVNMGWAYVADYKSEVLPVHPDVAAHGDQIAECLKACRKHGLQLHVWHVCWNMGHRAAPEQVKRMQDEQRTQVLGNGKATVYLAPHLPENLALEVNAFLELVRKYDIDGIHFDYIRYPQSNSDFSESSRIAFEALLGKTVENWPGDCQENGKYQERFLEWRRENISRLVETVHREAKKIRKDISISAAVYGDWNGARRSIGQDAEAWVKNGWLDFICPMNYFASDDEFERWTLAQLETVAGKIPVYPGIGFYLLSGGEQAAGQVQIARRLGCSGFMAFDLNANYANTILPALGEGALAQPAGTIMPHAAPQVKYRLENGRKDLYGKYCEGDQCMIDVDFPTGIRYQKSLEFTLEKNGMKQETVVLKVAGKARGARCSFTADVAGAYCLCLKDASQGLLSRSPVAEVLDEAGVERVRRENGPPAFRKDGKLRVAVWDSGAYGAPGIRKALEDSGMDVAELFNLKPENLRDVQVIVIPQPRCKLAQFCQAETAALLADYVKRGGGLLVTHAMIGCRGFVNVLPQAVVKMTGAKSKGQWLPVERRHAALTGLPKNGAETTYVDMLGFEIGREAVKLLQAQDGTALAAAATYGKGRYIPCGLCLGVGAGDKYVDLTAEEALFLVNAVRWLGKAK